MGPASGFGVVPIRQTQFESEATGDRRRRAGVAGCALSVDFTGRLLALASRLSASSLVPSAGARAAPRPGLRTGIATHRAGRIAATRARSLAAAVRSRTAMGGHRAVPGRPE